MKGVFTAKSAFTIMPKSAFTNTMSKSVFFGEENKTIFDSNLYQTREVNELIQQINNTSDNVSKRMLFRKIYTIITSPSLPNHVKILYSELTNAIKNIIYVNAFFPKTTIYCSIVPN